jgi:hypothetical protein
VNGQPIASPRATAIYPVGVPDYADASASEGQVLVRVGEKVEGRTKREATILTGEKEPQ